MKTQYSFCVQFCDADTSKHLRLDRLESYLLEANDDNVTKNGISPNFLFSTYNAAWVLLRLSLHMDELPAYKEFVTIETWMAGIAHSFVTRHFSIYVERDGQRKQIGEGTTIWTIINLTSRGVAKEVFADENWWQQHIDGEKLSIPRINANIQGTPQETKHLVSYSDLDMNFHLNSCRYAALMMDTSYQLANKVPFVFEIKYSHEIQQGEEITIRTTADSSCAHYEIVNQSGAVASAATLQNL